MYSEYLKWLKTGLEHLQVRGHVWPGTEPDKTMVIGEGRVAEIMEELVAKLGGNYPFGHPEYAGQMLKPPHGIAWAAYALAMAINPNNHALDGGPPTSEMEKECVSELAAMFGFRADYLGHLSSSGTIANLEALWVAGRLHPGKAIACTTAAHYTHERISAVLGLPCIKIPMSPGGHPDMDFLMKHAPDIGTLVVTMGTTGTGAVEPLHVLAGFCRKKGIRIHLDAAYGGFFKLLQGSSLIDDAPWELTSLADSIVIDPHKHGLQPYGCGCVLFRDASVGRLYKHDSPYTYFTSDELHLGEISLECSRAGASAAALWATLKAFPLSGDTGFGPVLQQCRMAALEFAGAVAGLDDYTMIGSPELDIVIFAPLSTGRLSSQVSESSKTVFRRGMDPATPAGDRLYLSLYRMPAAQLPEDCGIEADTEEITVLRSTLMKPEHRGFIPEMVERLKRLAR
ncbi:MAG: aspartate aminotransferase family protein [Rhodothermaceae bacterium]|nr:aspartate aminotransferase family protein [Rhodothermaceae bacterium]